jgi:CRISPR/Cas system-associated exonuclease Cas4 (RecB family)
VIEKDEVVMERLIEIAEKGLSPTTLSQFLICPMRFYFSTVLRLDETSEVEETIDFRTLGTVVHQVLQDFYTPFAGRFPGESDYRQMESNIGTQVKAAMNKHYSGGDTETGRNLLIVRVAETWIKRYLEMESKAGYSTEKGDHFICAEQQLESFVTLKNDSSPALKIRLKGTADRIDRVNGITRIIDYKTGKVDASDLKKTPIEVFANEKESFPEKAFQLMFYQFLAKNHPDLFPQPEKVEAGIITFRKLADGFLPLNSGDVLPLDMANEFGNHLTQLLEELFDKTTPFYCTPYEKRCANCNYKQICRREYAQG